MLPYRNLRSEKAPHFVAHTFPNASRGLHSRPDASILWSLLLFRLSSRRSASESATALSGRRRGANASGLAISSARVVYCRAGGAFRIVDLLLANRYLLSNVTGDRLQNTFCSPYVFVVPPGQFRTGIIFQKRDRAVQKSCISSKVSRSESLSIFIAVSFL